MDIHRHWPETHFVIARLIAQFSSHGGRAVRRIRRRRKLRLNIEIAGEHSGIGVADFDLLRRGIRCALRDQRTPSPCQFQRNQKFVLGFVAVDMKTWQYANLQCFCCRASCFDRHLIRWLDNQLILLRQTKRRQEKKDGQKRLFAFRREGSEFHCCTRSFRLGRRVEERRTVRPDQQ